MTDSPGLYFLGLPWQHTRGSALLGWVKDDAEYIAQRDRRLPAAGAAEPRRWPPSQLRSRSNEMSTTPDHFPTDVAGLPEAHAPERVELADGDEFDLRIAPVAKRIGDDTVRMLAYNGSIPGPILEVQEGSEIVVNIENQGDMEATVHWHGLRLENRYDGTHETQTPIAGRRALLGPRHVPGSRRLLVPPAHPRGLRPGDGPLRQRARRAGRPRLLAARQPRDLPLTLDDILLEDGKVAPFSRAETTHVAMGRFGDVLLVNGETDLSLDAQARRGRPPLPHEHREHARVQGRAAGRAHEARRRRQRPRRARGVRRGRRPRALRARGRRRPVRPAGDLTLEHRTPERVYPLAAIRVSDERVEPSFEEQFEVLRTNADMVAERERIARRYLDAEPGQDALRCPSPRWTLEARGEAPVAAYYAARCIPRS